MSEQARATVPPEGACRKQKPTMKAWPERYAKIEGRSLNFYSKKGEPPSKKRGSSISDVLGCSVRLGLEKFTFDGTQFLIALERRGHPAGLPDLDDGGVSQFCFKRQADRDRFAVALQNLAAGREWDEPAGENAAAVQAGRSTVSVRGPTAAGSQDAGAERPQVDENGGQADLRRCNGSLRGKKNPLLIILVNNTQHVLTRVASFEDSGAWVEPPPEAIGACSTVACASAGAAGPMGIGTTGTTGAIAFRGANIDVVFAYARPVLGEHRIGGGVFRAGFVTAAKLSRKATVGHNSSRCSYDRLISVHAAVPASGGAHIAWHSPGGVQAAAGSLPQHPTSGVPFAVYVVSDQPPQIAKLLQPILAKAQRSMLVRVENHAWVSLEKRADKCDSGMWKTEAPDVIPPESTVIFASESMGAGTDAHVTYAMSITTGGVAAEALVTLRWVNPLVGTGAKGQFARGKYVDITTEFSCSPGLVVEFDGPSQVDNSTVTFVISTEAGAQPGRFHPEKGSVTTGRTLGRPRAERTGIQIPLPLLQLPQRLEPASGQAAQLTDRAAKAMRSMVVYVDNRTPFNFRRHSMGTPSGTWTEDGEPPTRIQANQLALVVSESTGMGTEAFVKYTGELSTDRREMNAHASFYLRWVNPKVISAQRGRYVETKTDFDCNPGLVLHTIDGGPTQMEPSCVRFVIEMKDHAQPVHYNPAKYRSVQSAGAALRATSVLQSVGTERAAGIARVASQPIDQNSSLDVMWRRRLPLVDMWLCTEDCPVRSGPHAASREVGILPKGTLVRIVEDAWVRTDGSWVPALALRLVGDGCCTQNLAGAVTQLDGTSQPTFSVEKDNVVAADHGTQTVIRRYRKGDKFVGLRKVSSSHSVIIANECWVPRWSVETGRPYMLRRRATHPPFESHRLQRYTKRIVELDKGQRLERKYEVAKDHIVHWQFSAGDQPYQPVKARITTQPPGLDASQVVFRQAMSSVDCFPIKTFEAHDFPVRKMNRGEVVRQQNGGRAWRDYDRRWKIAHSSRRNPARPLWSLQPHDDPDSDRYLRVMPSQLGFDQSSKIAVGEFTASETGVLTIELDNTEAYGQKQVTYEAIFYGPEQDADKRRSKLERTRSQNRSATGSEARMGSTRSQRHRASHSLSLSNQAQEADTAGVASPCEQLVSQLRNIIATGQADPELIAEQYCTERSTGTAGEGRVTVDGIHMALSSFCIECQSEELQDTLRFFGFEEPTGSIGDPSSSISSKDFLAKIMPPHALVESSASERSDSVSTSESTAESSVKGTAIFSNDSGAEGPDSGSADEDDDVAMDTFEWLVIRCPYRVCPIKAQWSSVSGAVAPGKAGVAWGMAIGAGIGAMAGGVGTGLGAAIGASIGGMYGLNVREGDLDGVFYSISFRERTVIRSYADFKQLARLCKKADIPPLPQPPGPTESTLHATSLMEGQCVLARQLDRWLHAVARELIIKLDKPVLYAGPTPVFLAFLGVLFKTATDECGAPSISSSSSSSSDSDEEDDRGRRRHKQSAVQKSLHDDEDAGTCTEAEGLGSPWKMVRGAQACRSRDPNANPVPFPSPLSSYFVAAVEWRVNYAFQVSQIPGLKTGAHSVIVVTLRNGDSAEHTLVVDAVTEKVRLRLIPKCRLGEWRHAKDPGTAVLFKRAELSANADSSESGVEVRAASELWERARVGSETYDAGTKNCHHFARDMWNWCVVKALQSTDMPTDMLAQDLLMAASEAAATGKGAGDGPA